jgi:N-acetylglucosamine-6-phosphate deacetylase
MNTFSSKNIDEIALLLVDLWGCHKDPNTIDFALPNKYVDVLLITDRTTEYVQPSDVFFFREEKFTQDGRQSLLARRRNQASSRSHSQNAVGVP